MLATDLSEIIPQENELVLQVYIKLHVTIATAQGALLNFKGLQL